MPVEFKYDVFLSYSIRDKPVVRELAERLKHDGLRVWFDEWIIQPGDDIYLAIERGLEASRTLVLCLSPAALDSDWVGLERSTVLFRDPANAGRRFIPLLLADCKLPDTLRRYKYLDYREEAEAAFNELLNGICDLFDLRSNAETAAAQAERLMASILTTTTVAVGPDGNTFGHPKEETKEFKHRLVWQSGRTMASLLRHLRSVEEWYRSISIAGMKQPRNLDDLYVELSLTDDPHKYRLRKTREESYTIHDIILERAHVVVLGEPGSGKTTTLKKVAKGFLTGEYPSSVPIVLRLRDLGPSQRLVQMLKNILEIEFEQSKEFAAELAAQQAAQKEAQAKENELRSRQRKEEESTMALRRELHQLEQEELKERVANRPEEEQEAKRRKEELEMKRRREKWEVERRMEKWEAKLPKEELEAKRRKEESEAELRIEEWEAKRRKEEREAKRGGSTLTSPEQRAASQKRSDRMGDLRKLLGFASERGMNARRDIECAQRITFRLTEDYHVTEIKALAALLDSLRVILLLDGYDELAHAARLGVLDEIRELQAALSSSRILLTSRSADYSGGLEGVLVYEINRLSDMQIEHFVRLWFSSHEGKLHTADGFMIALKTTPYADLARRPLSLAHLCLVFENDGALPEVPITIYRRILYLLLQEWDTERRIARKSRYAHFDVSRKIDFLSALAFKLTSRRNRGLTFSTTDLEAIYSELHRKFALPAGESREVAHEIESHTGIIVQATYDTLEFSHKSIQEYLVAYYLCRLPDVLGGYRLLRDCPNELAITLALTVEPSHLCCRLFRNKKEQKVPEADWVRPFVARVLQERPCFEPSAELGSTVLWMLGNTPLHDADVRRFLSLEAISESVKLLFENCAIEVPMGVPSEKVRIIMRNTVPARYPLPKDFVFDRTDLTFLPGIEALSRVFLGKLVSFDLEAGYGCIDTGRLQEQVRFEFSSLYGASTSSLSIHSLVEYEFEDESCTRVVSLRVVPASRAYAK